MKITSKIGAIVELDNGKKFTIQEGDIINNLKYQVSGGEPKVITGAVRVIRGVTSNNSAFVNSCPPEPYVNKTVAITGFVVDISTKYDADFVTVNSANILDIESVSPDPMDIEIGPGESFAPLDEVITKAPEGATVTLAAGEYAAPLKMSKSVTIKGNGAATITGAVEIGAPAAAAAAAIEVVDARAMASAEEGPAPIHVTLEGVKLTKDAIINVTSSIASLKMINCTFEGHNLTKKTMPIFIGTGATEPMELVITGCKFGDENEHSYNLLECYAPLSKCDISGNDFSANCCTHNHMSIYGLADNGEVNLTNNHIAMSRNFVRVGFKGAPRGVVNMVENSYDETDVAEYAGLALVQPYGKQTTTFAGLTINIDKTINKTAEPQLVYFFVNNGVDLEMTPETKPVIKVDGEDITASVPIRA